jgi:hypothetical protein
VDYLKDKSIFQDFGLQRVIARMSREPKWDGFVRSIYTRVYKLGKLQDFHARFIAVD